MCIGRGTEQQWAWREKKMVGGFNPPEKYEFVSWDNYS